MKWRGSGLLFLLVVASVLATVGFSLAGSVLYETWRGQGLDRAEHVEEAALASLHKAIANLAYHPDYHEAFGEDWPNATHSSLTFATRALPYSTNNLGQDAATTGFGGVVVPAHCAHLVAVAECGTTRQANACMLHIPKYPYAIASSGPLKTRGDFWVGLCATPTRCPTHSARARVAYEDSLHARRHPALLEKTAGNQFQARIFPIRAKGEKELEERPASFLEVFQQIGHIRARQQRRGPGGRNLRFGQFCFGILGCQRCSKPVREFMVDHVLCDVVGAAFHGWQQP